MGDIKAFANAAFIKQGGTLVCGAGLSKVPVALANEGFAAPIFAVDRDELAVKYQKKIAAESKRAQKSVRAMYLDVSDMAEKVDDNSVQNVFDKACLDAIACDKSSSMTRARSCASTSSSSPRARLRARRRSARSRREARCRRRGTTTSPRSAARTSTRSSRTTRRSQRSRSMTRSRA